MTKLNVVIPANEVTVGNVTYRKVDRKAQAGDIVKALKDGVDIDAGAFYRVTFENHFADNNGDGRSLSVWKHEVYEAVAPVITEVTAEITFENAQYRKVDRSAHEGDVIVFTEEADYVTEGTPYLVNEIDSADDAQITDDDGDDYDTCGRSFDVYEKASVDTAVGNVRYREVKRWAEKGERIKIVDRDSDEREYEQDAEFIVNGVDGDGDVRVSAGGRDRKLVLLEEYVVLEPVTNATPTDEPVPVPSKYSIGDYVKVTGNSVGHNYEIGSVVKITYAEDLSGETRQKLRAEKSDGTTGNWAVTNDVEPADEPKPARLSVGDYAKVIETGAGFPVGTIVMITIDDHSTIPYKTEDAKGEQHWAQERRLIPATEAEFLAQKKPAEPVRLNVGDFAKVTQRGHESQGSVVIITGNNRAGSYIYSTKNIDGTTADIFALDAVIEATAEEVAEAQEAARWAKIGRKVGEFKRGDIVKGIGIHTQKSEIGTVRHTSDGLLGVDVEPDNYSAMTRAEVTLITPVEQRFDAEQAAA